MRVGAVIGTGQLARSKPSSASMGGRHVCPLPGTAHQPAGEQPAGRGGYDLPSPWRHQPGGRDCRGAPIHAAPYGCRDLGLQCFADWAQTAGGADQRQPANQFAMIGAELSRDAAACRRAYQVNRRGEGVAQRLGMLGRQLGHRHTPGQPGAAVEEHQAPRRGQRQQRMKGAVHHCIAADPGDRHQSRGHRETEGRPRRRRRATNQILLARPPPRPCAGHTPRTSNAITPRRGVPRSRCPAAMGIVRRTGLTGAESLFCA